MFFHLPYLAEFSVLGNKFCMYILELLLVNLLSPTFTSALNGNNNDHKGD